MTEIKMGKNTVWTNGMRRGGILIKNNLSKIEKIRKYIFVWNDGIKNCEKYLMRGRATNNKEKRRNNYDREI